jgi:crossover junction endodeoxyribonuclease RusA
MITINLPFPDPRLNPNASKGQHWAATSKLRKIARETAFVLTRQSGAPYISGNKADFEMVITFFQPDKRKRDRDNLLSAAKPQLDGVADAIGIDDSQFNPVTIKREYGVKPGLMLVEIMRK